MENLKEYLRKNSDGTYSYIGTVQPDHVSNFMIKIPEGAEIYIDLGFRNHSFYKDNFKLCWCGVRWENTVHNSMNLEHWNNTPVLWKRHTHPEELPFIDDEPLQSLNDQYAEIEKVRQSQRKASEKADPTIKETLNQRQSQYGSFEDVATATQDLLKILERTGLKSLPSMHKEALHMICSKMVRIVNGDHNFIESWHDIAGYATLMENELRVTDGATNSRLTYQKVINGKLQDI